MKEVLALPSCTHGSVVMDAAITSCGCCEPAPHRSLPRPHVLRSVSAGDGSELGLCHGEGWEHSSSGSRVSAGFMDLPSPEQAAKGNARAGAMQSSVLQMGKLRHRARLLCSAKGQGEVEELLQRLNGGRAGPHRSTWSGHAGSVPSPMRPDMS